MSNVTLKKVSNKKELKEFVTFPFKIYQGSKYWVPPLIAEEMTTFNQDKNPVFENAEAQLFLAYKNGVVVGRIAALINWIEINEQQNKRMRFGWMDFIDDLEVSKALLDQAEEIGRENNLDFIEGPLGFSNLDKAGALTFGYEHIGTMATWYNHPYYIEHFAKLGYLEEKEYVESKFKLESLINSRFLKAYNAIVTRYGYKPRNFYKTKEIIPHIDDMFALLDRSFGDLPSYVPISSKERNYLKKKFINFVNPEYIKFVFDKDDRLIAFGVALPSFSKALQEINGKLWPLGFLKLLKAKKETETLLLYLIGVDPEYQNKAAHAVVFHEFYQTFKSKGVVNCIRLPELANNTAEQQIWKDSGSEVIKRRKTFKKNL